MGKKEPAFPLVREKEDVSFGINVNCVGPHGKGSPIGVLGRDAQQHPLFPWFSVAAAHRDRLQTGRHKDW
jgi:hypothetical protein